MRNRGVTRGFWRKSQHRRAEGDRRTHGTDGREEERQQPQQPAVHHHRTGGGGRQRPKKAEGSPSVRERPRKRRERRRRASPPPLAGRPLLLLCAGRLCSALPLLLSQARHQPADARLGIIPATTHHPPASLLHPLSLPVRLLRLACARPLPRSTSAACLYIYARQRPPRLLRPRHRTFQNPPLPLTSTLLCSPPRSTTPMAVVEAAAVDHAAPPRHEEEEAPGAGAGAADAAGEREMRDLEDLLSKLNPMAEEFVPPSLASPVVVAAVAGAGPGPGPLTPAPLSPAAYGFYPAANAGFAVASPAGHRGVVGFPAVADAAHAGRGRKKGGAGGGFGGHGHPGRRRTNSRTSMAQRDEVIRRTVYVSDIDHQVTEENLAALFINCGQVVDCRMCGDPNSVLRFAFIEFTDEEGARAALNLSGTVLGYYPVRVLPSKTAIAPVNPTFLPRSDDEREMCARTIYCTNIDKKVTQADLKLFFESICGEVFRLRLLGDYHHSTRIAFVEFVMAESATAALNCSGVILGSLPIRVSPSKTPVRPRAPRQLMH